MPEFIGISFVGEGVLYRLVSILLYVSDEHKCDIKEEIHIIYSASKKVFQLRFGATDRSYETER